MNTEQISKNIFAYGLFVLLPDITVMFLLFKDAFLPSRASFEEINKNFYSELNFLCINRSSKINYHFRFFKIRSNFIKVLC